MCIAVQSDVKYSVKFDAIMLAESVGYVEREVEVNSPRYFVTNGHTCPQNNNVGKGIHKIWVDRLLTQTKCVKSVKLPLI